MCGPGTWTETGWLGICEEDGVDGISLLRYPLHSTTGLNSTCLCVLLRSQVDLGVPWAREVLQAGQA